MEILVVILIVVGALALASVPFLLRSREGRGELDAPDKPRPGGTTVLDRPRPETPPVGVDVEPVPAPEPELVEPEPEPEPVAPVRPRFRDRLGKARAAMSGYVGSILGRSKVDAETWEELEEALVLADTGIGVATELIEATRARATEAATDDPSEVLALLSAEMRSRLTADRSLRIDEGETNVWLFVGVNGVGKTTTIGKVGLAQAEVGRRVLMAAGDTFRAAAGEQLGTWAERTGAEFVRGGENADPAAVIFDGIQAAAARGCDLVLADTAGRLHNKSNLMDELSKVRRVADRDPGHVVEVLLVIDATTGQNGLNQAQVFAEAVDVTGVVLTKLDGSAKGGIVFAIETQLGIPVKLVGLGETAADLVPFDPDEFVEALLALDA